MNFQILTIYPVWFFILCILLGALYSYILYHKSEFSKKDKFFTHPNVLLAITRFLVVCLISFFLLSPFLKKFFEKTEKPIVAIAIDNSKSILLSKDSLEIKSEFVAATKHLITELSKSYDVQNYSFGKDIKKELELDFTQNRTNISNILDYIYEQNYNKNLRAVILASDGLYNEGNHPSFKASAIKTPLFTIALGDTTTKKDLILDKINHNSLAYLGNQFLVEIEVNAQFLKLGQSRLSVFLEKEKIYSEDLNITKSYFEKSISVLIEAKNTGLQKITAQLIPIDGESNTLNNSKTSFIEILENKKKILLLANSAHPDIKAIRNALQESENHLVEALVVKEFRNPPSEMDQYDLIILHQLPSIQYPIKKILEQLDKSKIPVFYILGAKTNIPAFNKSQTGLQLIQKKKAYNSAEPIFNSDFNYFNIENTAIDIIQEWPPLVTPFANYNVVLDNQVLFYQKIGKVKSNIPLLLYYQDIDKRTAILCGEGFWKWPLIEYKNTQSQIISNSIIQKTAQFLSTVDDKRYFRLKEFNNQFYEDQQITFECELYNQSFEKLNNAEIKLTIRDEENETYEYLFQENDNSYILNIGYLPKGRYFFEANTKSNGQNQKLSGEFIVKTVDLEFNETTANHKLLFNLANNNDGKMYFPSQMDSLLANLLQRSDIKPITYFDQESKDLINIKWLFFLLLFLLSFEWFMRKFFGSY